MPAPYSWKRSNSFEAMVVICCFQVPTWNCALISYELQEHQPTMSEVSVEMLNTRQDLMSSWSSAQKKKVLRRRLQKHEEDFKKLITSENLYQICHGE